MRLGLSTLVCALACGSVSAVWTTIHHDELNRGFAAGIHGPVDSPPCNASIRAEDIAHEIYQTGVVSTNNEYLVTGTSSNTLSVVDVVSLNTYTV